MSDLELTQESIESTIKSISRNDNISCRFTQGDTCFSYLNQSDFSAESVNISSQDASLNTRAIGDMAALYLAYHNSNIHRQYQFNSPEKQSLFDDFEKARLVTLGSKKYPGIKVNLQNFIQSESSQLIDIWNLPLLLIDKSLSILDKTQTINFEPSIYKILEELKKQAANQESFSIITADFIHNMDTQDDGEQSESNNDSDDGDKQENIPQSKSRQEDVANKSPQSNNKKEQEDSAQGAQSIDSKGSGIEKGTPTIGGVEAKSILHNEQIEFVDEYKIFTKKYDSTCSATDLATKIELERLRENLDLQIKSLEKISHKLKAKLKRKLLSKKVILSQHNKEEGFVDHRKFTKLIISPLKKDNYIDIKENDYHNTIISILIDNSGSMRGNPVTMSAMASEVIAGILEKFSIKTEILGFTTLNWHGGKSKKLWQISGSPKNPGRLSDLCHIVYKNSNQPLKKARTNLALMLKEGILKENIDGEALLWASKRLSMSAESRKILIVISDGAPIDDSTNSNNKKGILTNHLQHVIANIEKKSNIELAAIGIGHDVANFYKNSITIKSLDDLGDEMINKICEML